MQAGKRCHMNQTQERLVRHRLGQLLTNSPIPPEELADNLALYLRRQPLTSLLSPDTLYHMVLDIPPDYGSGVHRGHNLAALTGTLSLRLNLGGRVRCVFYD